MSLLYFYSSIQAFSALVSKAPGIPPLHSLRRKWVRVSLSVTFLHRLEVFVQGTGKKSQPHSHSLRQNSLWRAPTSSESIHVTTTRHQRQVVSKTQTQPSCLQKSKIRLRHGYLARLHLPEGRSTISLLSLRCEDKLINCYTQPRMRTWIHR